MKTVAVACRLVEKFREKLRGFELPAPSKRFIARNRTAFGLSTNKLRGLPSLPVEFNGMSSSHIAYSYLTNVLAREHKAVIRAYVPQPSAGIVNKLLFALKQCVSRGDVGVYRSFGAVEVFEARPTVKQTRKAARLTLAARASCVALIKT